MGNINEARKAKLNRKLEGSVLYDEAKKLREIKNITWYKI